MLVVVLFASPIFIASTLDSRLHNKQPNVRPYKWGYWMGCSCFLPPLIMIVGDFVPLLIIFSIFVPIGFLVIDRNRWALIVVTLLTCNPVIWIANIFYIRNRWREMGDSSSPTQPTFSEEPTAPAPIVPSVTPDEQKLLVARMLDEKFAPPSPPLPPPQSVSNKPVSSGGCFFVRIAYEVKGPFSVDQLKALIEVGTINLDTQCCKEGTQNWMHIYSLAI